MAAISNLSKVLLQPYVTEKSTGLQEGRYYAFKVLPEANKVLIKKEIEDFYKVKVEKVQILNKKGKERQIRGKRGKKKGFKKALIKLKEGYKIEL